MAETKLFSVGQWLLNNHQTAIGRGGPGGAFAPWLIRMANSHQNPLAGGSGGALAPPWGDLMMVFYLSRTGNAGRRGPPANGPQWATTNGQNQHQYSHIF